MYYQDTAIILSRKDYREDDLLIHVYTENHGKVRLAARGAKKIKSKLAGHIEPMNLVELNWVSGKNIDQLTGAVMCSSFSALKQDLSKINYGLHFINLVDELTRENVKDARIFYLLKAALDFLEEKSNNYSIARLAFGYKLLYLLGFDVSKKKGLALSAEIDFVVKNSMEQIAGHKNINDKLFNLNRILINEMEEHLGKEIQINKF